MPVTAEVDSWHTFPAGVSDEVVREECAFDRLVSLYKALGTSCKSRVLELSLNTGENSVQTFVCNVAMHMYMYTMYI